MTGQNRARWETKLNAGRKEAESERGHVAAKGKECYNLNGKPQPRGNTQINRNGLI